MLKSLFIQNFVLIDHLDINFDQGFSVITGETGAGKSIILGALSLVLGQRADNKSIKNGSDKCIIEATFDISSYKLEEFFLTKDLEYDAETCILRREMYASGKSRAFINDSPVPLTVMKELGSRLIDIHSQHQNLLLGDNRFQLKVIDVMAENEILLILYKKEYSRYLSLKRELKSLTDKAAQTQQEEDYIRFQLEQLTDARLEEGEQEELEQELETLSHAEEIKGALYKINQLLNGEEQSAVQL
ncbi:MAG: AAA family ATPase, partial [Parabacteroides sp.]|nr:AAA family ATPase [Parabacteroides sp.]